MKEPPSFARRSILLVLIVTSIWVGHQAVACRLSLPDEPARFPVLLPLLLAVPLHHKGKDGHTHRYYHSDEAACTECVGYLCRQKAAFQECRYLVDRFRAAACSIRKMEKLGEEFSRTVKPLLGTLETGVFFPAPISAWLLMRAQWTRRGKLRALAGGRTILRAPDSDFSLVESAAQELFRSNTDMPIAVMHSTLDGATHYVLEGVDGKSSLQTYAGELKGQLSEDLECPVFIVLPLVSRTDVSRPFRAIGVLALLWLEDLPISDIEMQNARSASMLLYDLLGIAASNRDRIENGKREQKQSVRVPKPDAS